MQSFPRERGAKRTKRFFSPHPHLAPLCSLKETFPRCLWHNSYTCHPYSNDLPSCLFIVTATAKIYYYYFILPFFFHSMSFIFSEGNLLSLSRACCFRRLFYTHCWRATHSIWFLSRGLTNHIKNQQIWTNELISYDACQEMCKNQHAGAICKNDGKGGKTTSCQHIS